MLDRGFIEKITVTKHCRNLLFVESVAIYHQRRFLDNLYFVGFGCFLKKTSNASERATDILLDARSSIYITFTPFHISYENSCVSFCMFPPLRRSHKKIPCIAFPSGPIAPIFLFHYRWLILFLREKKSVLGGFPNESMIFIKTICLLEDIASHCLDIIKRVLTQWD